MTERVLIRILLYLIYQTLPGFFNSFSQDAYKGIHSKVCDLYGLSLVILQNGGMHQIYNTAHKLMSL